MTRIFHDADADLDQLNGHTVAVIGYGNQGRAQALNMRDSVWSAWWWAVRATRAGRWRSPTAPPPCR